MVICNGYRSIKVMESTVIQRITEIIEAKSISINKLSKVIGISQSTLNRQLTGESQLSSLTVEMILGYYKDVSPDWLLTGRGTMDRAANGQETRPRIPYDAAAGSLIGIDNEGVTDIECEQLPLIRSLPDYSFTIYIKGNSMEPELHSGDEVACLIIDDKKFIQWGRVHVLDTDQGIIVKQIYADGDYIRCHSFNSVSYPDFSIMRSQIRAVALVVGMLRL